MMFGARRRKDRFAPSRVVTRDIRPLVLLLLLSACRERTPGVPRWKTRANDVRSGDGET